MPSPAVIAGAASTRRPEDVLAQRRARLAADLRAEGCNDATVARLTTDETVGRIVAHEERAVAAIVGLFSGIGGKI